MTPTLDHEDSGSLLFRIASFALLGHLAFSAFSAFAFATFLHPPYPEWLQTPQNQKVMAMGYTYGGATTVTLGAVAGYVGGTPNQIIMRLTDVMLTFPGIFLPMALAAALGRGMVPAMLALSVTWWPGYCRLVEAQMLKVREEDFVAGARAIDASQRRVIFRHILPNTLTAIVVKASMDFGFAVLALASLGFIGIGIQPPEPDWGSMIALGRRFMPGAWWISTFPGLFMFVMVLGFNLLGDGLRDLLDPNATVK